MQISDGTNRPFTSAITPLIVRCKAYPSHASAGKKKPAMAAG
jgi:hypothetical protein